jgi:tyrosyl-tRNA synthetase
MIEIAEIENLLKKDANPVIYKKKLAFEIVKQLNNEQEAEKAQDYFERTVQQKELPSDIPTVKLKNTNQTIVDVLLEINLASSKTEARRLIEQGGVKVNNEKISDPGVIFHNLLKDNEALIQVGPRKFVRIKC